MENVQHMNVSGSQEDATTNSLEQKGGPKSHGDIMTWRLKNRERQRRYRARKRLEADMKRASVPNQSDRPPQVHQEQNGYVDCCPSVVHCTRNWKKDARNAHFSKEVSGAKMPELALNSEIQMHGLVPFVPVELPVASVTQSDNSVSFPSGETRVKIGRRNWKAEARKKN